MKSLLLTTLFSLLLSLNIYGQERTEESKVSINKTTGDTTLTESVILSQSEDITPRDQMFVVNPLKFFLFYNLSYFQKINNNLVVGGGIQVPTISGIDGFGFNAEVRFYPKGRNLRGFYVAPNISFNHLKTGDAETNPFSVGVLAGWQWFPGDQFAIGLGIGVDYYTGNVRGDDNDLDSYNGTAPALRFDIGYAW